ncbi:MAG: hypothetical protein Q8P90_02065 [bacterium]|nr:hypothetical protein [bacterium]
MISLSMMSKFDRITPPKSAIDPDWHNDYFAKKCLTPESTTPDSSTICGLDLINIDGRWGQVISPQDEILFIEWIDTNKTEMLNLKNYEVEELYNSLVAEDFLHARPNEMSAKDISQIHWGSEQEEHPHLRGKVTVWGKLRKKESTT